MLASASRNIPLPLSESHQQGGQLGNDNNLCTIRYKDFLIVSKHTPPFGHPFPKGEAAASQCSTYQLVVFAQNILV